MKDRIATVIYNKKIADGIFEMRLKVEDLPQINAGQFVQIKVPDNAHILRRPFCIADYDSSKNTFDIKYQIKGEGTKILSQCNSGQQLMAVLPLGNGFKVEGNQNKIMLVGGGMGSAILPALFTQYPDKEFYVYMGFSNQKFIICSELEKNSKGFVVSTDDGSNGNKGFITEKIANDLAVINPDLVLCCGPEVMYKTLKKTFDGFKNPVQVSLEGRMGCGIGACLVCACKIKKAGASQTSTLRVCKDGPVFGLYEVEL